MKISKPPSKATFAGEMAKERSQLRPGRNYIGVIRQHDSIEKLIEWKRH